MSDICDLMIVKTLHHHREQGGQHTDNKKREHQVFHSAYLCQDSVTYGIGKAPEGLSHIPCQYLSEKRSKVYAEIREKLFYLAGQIVQIQFSGQCRQFHPVFLYFIKPVIVSIKDNSTGIPARRIVTLPNSSTWAAMAWYPASLQSPAQNWQR